MKKTMLALSALSLISVGHAGTMGDTKPVHPITPFIAGEASYTWNTINTFTIGALTASETNQGWGGRLSTGLAYSYNDKVKLIGEAGGGYYGSTNLSISNEASSRLGIDGYDILAGASYTLGQFNLFENIPVSAFDNMPGQFDVFFKFGFMVENVRRTVTTVLANAIPGGVYNGTIVSKYITTQVYPEIKVGGDYNLNDNWAATVAYMHVFGTSPGGTTQVTATSAPAAITQNSSNTLSNPTLNSIMFGLRYSFV
ncbi:MAG: hypothetical protein NXI01_01290 [Gammaproteobacteria bacterium]|nr:hypothetical protein [Gammaproteobacteria bacterium]